mgnify:CR=1 FL=1
MKQLLENKNTESKKENRDKSASEMGRSYVIRKVVQINSCEKHFHSVLSRVTSRWQIQSKSQ